MNLSTQRIEVEGRGNSMLEMDCFDEYITDAGPFANERRIPDSNCFRVNHCRDILSAGTILCVILDSHERT